MYRQSRFPHPLLLALPVLVLALLLDGGDLWLADQLYALEGSRWSLQSYWLTNAVLHEGGRRLSVMLGLLVLLAWAASHVLPRRQAWQRPLAYLLLSVLTSTLLVAALKSASPLDCPWDLVRYGGQHADSGHWPGSPASPGKCFPAGHAGAGYAWMASYFFLREVKPGWRRVGLMAALASGATFGIAQQLRGAHFLSHDLFAALLCWAVAAGLARLLLQQRTEPTGETA